MPRAAWRKLEEGGGAEGHGPVAAALDAGPPGDGEPIRLAAQPVAKSESDVAIPVVIHRANRNHQAIPGCRVSARCVAQRCT